MGCFFVRFWQHVDLIPSIRRLAERIPRVGGVREPVYRSQSDSPRVAGFCMWRLRTRVRPELVWQHIVARHFVARCFVPKTAGFGVGFSQPFLIMPGKCAVGVVVTCERYCVARLEQARGISLLDDELRCLVHGQCSKTQE